MYELPSGLLLRTARAADVAHIVSLLRDDPLEAERETRSGAATSTRYAESFAAVDLDPHHELIVVTAGEGGRPLATAHLIVIPGLSWQGESRAQIQGFRVAKELRGQGIGTEIMTWVLGRSRERGCGFVQVVADKRRDDAARFYSRFGFKPTHEGLKLRLGD